MRFIAEIGSNHNKDINRVYSLIYSAKQLGFWGVKFQLFKGSKMYKDKKKAAEMEKLELPEEFIPKISKYCKSINIKFGCTPFYDDAIDLLSDYIDFYKVSSFDVFRKKFLIKITQAAGLRKIFLSLGMMDIDKVKPWFVRFYYECIAMHCISTYPAKLENLCMNRISKYGLNGYSDHSGEIPAILAAMVQGADYTELHFDLDDRAGGEPKLGHVWTESKIRKLFNIVNKIKTANAKEFSIPESSKKYIANAEGFRD